jgi:hypothetical protein
MKRDRRRFCRWTLVWALPVAWAATCFASAHFPGDEYGLWVVGSVAGLWILAIVGDNGGIWDFLPIVLATGAATMAVVGLLLDLLRTPRRWWLILWGVAAVGFCVITIGSYPSYERAMSKNGSLQAYIFFSLNAGLYCACLVLLLVMPIWRLLHRRPPAGHCQECGYNLKGNVSGVCPECGEAVGANLR